MDQRYVLNIAHYQGPIDKLLELIEARELEITEISLAAVTDDFLKYLERIAGEYQRARNAGAATMAPAAYMRLLADFIVVASRLVFIKSKALIPNIALSDDEEAGIKDLEERLRRYRELRPAMKSLHGLWRNGSREFSREYFLHVRGLLLTIRAQEGAGETFFYPGSALGAAAMQSALKKILALTEITVEEERIVQEKIITLEEKVREIIGRMRGLGETTFRGVAEGASRIEAVVAFLAVLHLAREQLVSLEQESADSDIIIRHARAAR